MEQLVKKAQLVPKARMAQLEKEGLKAKEERMVLMVPEV
jgi:hypothetical protein